MTLRPNVLLSAGGTGEGGGGTYVLAVANELARGGDRGLGWRFLASRQLAPHLEPLGLDVVRQPEGGALRRTLWEQTALAAQNGGEVLLAAAGFAPVARRAPFVLVAHNALYYGPTLPATGWRRARLSVERRLARTSTRRARTVIAPSRAMAELVAQVGRGEICVAPFGPGLAEGVRAPAKPPFVFLHRTGWGPHKGFGVLLEACRKLAARQPGAFLVRSGSDPASVFARSFGSSAVDRELLSDPLIGDHVEIATFPLGSPSQRLLEGHAVVVPSPVESFSFPLAEAVAFGLPVVAADRPYARELCGAGALYFTPGDSGGLADAMERLLVGESPPPAAPGDAARLSWASHVDALAEACRRIPVSGP